MPLRAASRVLQAQTMKASSAKPTTAARPPEGWLRRGAFGLIMSTRFNYMVMSIVMINICAMSLDYYRIEVRLRLRLRDGETERLRD